MKRRLGSGFGMLSATTFAVFCIVGTTVGNKVPQSIPAPPTADEMTFFETKIRPVLAENCLPCHGKEFQMSGLRLDSAAGLHKGGDSGPVIVAGDPDKSLLIHAIQQVGPIKMPPANTPGRRRLTVSEAADFASWIRMGTPYPESKSTTKVERAPLWSLQPVANPALPKVDDHGWVRNGIDAFVFAKLVRSHQKPSATADRRTLIRRLSYDLTGLPPTPAEVDAFLTDKRPNAYDMVVDRLLASPRYGERWARHWMDVARYADTKGYVFDEDRNYTNAYTYRSWLIHAFNSDLPYDKFVTEQLAADRLPENKDGDDKAALAALGFLTIGRRFLNQTPDIIDDRIDVTMRGLQAFTVGCARCHDHKFDPIPTQDYYSLYAIFNSSQEATVPISPSAIRDPWIKFNALVAESESRIRDLVVTQVRRLRQRVLLPDEQKTTAEKSPDIKPTLQALREEVVPSGDALSKLVKAFESAEQDRLSTMQRDLAELKKMAPTTPEFAMAMEDRANPSDGVVFKRGNPGNPGPVAPRRFLLALSKPDVEREHWSNGSGRLELAKAIVSRDNPLTARVFVNRVWQDHFGAGIVRTPSDFGHQGEKPTDPALLDYLATKFMNGGWSTKRLQRLIVTSSTYRQSSDVSETALNADPDNRNWGRMNRRRLDLEQMRDTLMDVSGRLDVAQVGGKSVDLWGSPYTRRRAVYGYVERQNLPGIFRTFDFASPDSTNARRFNTTVPQQALFFMNSPLSVQQSDFLAERPEIIESKDDAQRIRRIYQVLFQRLPDVDEANAGMTFLRKGVLLPFPTIWEYGFGEFDPTRNRIFGFTPLTTYADSSYRVSKAFPDPVLGYLVLNASGGHPGHDGSHQAIRRWISPANMTVHISGKILHGQAQGDGVCARIVTSDGQVRGEWRVHNGSAQTDVSDFLVKKGESIDFAVDPLANDGYDAFSWAPIIQSKDGNHSWDSNADFAAPAAKPLSRLTSYIQALMMTNEFMFID